jgi:hypothetical protein
MATGTYNRGHFLISQGAAALTGRTIRIAVVSGTKTGATAKTLNTIADLKAVGSVVVTMPAAAQLASLTVTEDDGNNRTNVDSADVAFPATAGVTGLMHVYYDEGSGTDATRQLIGWDDTNWGAGVPLDGGVNITIADWLRVS